MFFTARTFTDLPFAWFNLLPESCVTLVT